MALKLVAGPVLGFRGIKEKYWWTSALVVTEGNGKPKLKVDAGGLEYKEGDTTLLKTFGSRYVWRLLWAVVQSNEPRRVSYSIDDSDSFHYTIPVDVQEVKKPLRIAYGSCFGFHSLRDMKKVEDKNAMWKVLSEEHKQQPYHLMIMGGDQVYADLLWETIDPLKDMFNISMQDRIKIPFTPEIRKLVEKFYFDLYCERWTEQIPREVMAQVPMLMMWDDHDIFDGWGSYKEVQQQSDVFQGIYKIAREHFRIFQLQAKDDDDLGEATLLGKTGFTYAYRIGDIAIVALDMRSERTQNQVISLKTWNRLEEWMYGNLTKKIKVDGSEQLACKHLLVISSIPVVYINLNMLESVLGLLPGQQGLEDDFKDQWLSRTHQEERLRLIHRLLKFSKESGCRVTIVSGDVHSAGLGYIQSERDNAKYGNASVINQFISSAMVNTPPPGIIIYMMEKVLGDKIEDIDRGITARMLKFPGTAQRFIGARNWLSLTLDEQNRIWGEWFVEGETRPYTKVVHPVGALTS